MTIPKTKSGKTANDFHIPPKLLQQDRDLVNLILGSESMDDDERQYWFNLYSMMNAEQVGKLRDILTREREKLAEIDARYGKKRKPQLSAAQIRARNAKMQQEREKKQAELARREHEARKSEQHSDSILKELEDL